MALAIAFMYFFAFALFVPFTCALYFAFSGDRMRAALPDASDIEPDVAGSKSDEQTLALTA
jgi:hypothetical protein